MLILCYDLALRAFPAFSDHVKSISYALSICACDAILIARSNHIKRQNSCSFGDSYRILRAIEKKGIPGDAQALALIYCALGDRDVPSPLWKEVFRCVQSCHLLSRTLRLIPCARTRASSGCCVELPFRNYLRPLEVRES